MTYREERAGSVNRSSPTITLCFLSFLVKRENRLILFKGAIFEFFEFR